MAIPFFGFAVLIIFVKVIVSTTQEFERRNRFKRDFERFLNNMPPDSDRYDDYVMREDAYRNYKKREY